MKQTAAIIILQRAFTMVLAALILVFALFFLQSQNPPVGGSGENMERVFALTSFHGVADLPSAPENLPKISILFSVIPLLWAMVLLLTLLKVRRHLISPGNIFFLKINFVFVSAKAP